MAALDAAKTNKFRHCCPPKQYSLTNPTHLVFLEEAMHCLRDVSGVHGIVVRIWIVVAVLDQCYSTTDNLQIYACWHPSQYYALCFKNRQRWYKEHINVKANVWLKISDPRLYITVNGQVAVIWTNKPTSWVFLFTCFGLTSVCVHNLDTVQTRMKFGKDIIYHNSCQQILFERKSRQW